MAGARSLWRANGMKEEHFGRPLIAVVNSFSQFVPGHAHLHEVGQLIKREVEKLGCFAAEFNTIAIDDGIAMGHDGMLYSLPSRDLIADSIEYVCNAHRVDAMICISNCDKITPGMMMAAMRLNIPAIFVSGGPMEAGIIGDKRYDLVDVMVAAGDEVTSDEHLDLLEKQACPTCGSCSGLFTANSMNCLAEAIGWALPGNGTIVATHELRKNLFEDAARRLVGDTYKYYRDGDSSVLPRNIGNREAFLNAMKVDIAMGGSTNTILHLLAIAHEGEIEFNMKDIDRLSRNTPNLCKVAPSSSFHMEDVNRAGGIIGIMGELDRAGLLNVNVHRVDYFSLQEALSDWDVKSPDQLPEAGERYQAAPAGVRNLQLASQSSKYHTLDLDRSKGCIRDMNHAYSRDGGLAILYGNIAEKGCVIKTAGVDANLLTFNGKARVFHSQEEASVAILSNGIQPGEVVFILYEGPKGGPGMQEMLYPTSYIKSRKLDRVCALVTDGRFSGGTSGLSIGHISPEAAAGGNIALVRDGDIIKINIPERSIHLKISDLEMASRREEENQKGDEAFTPRRNRQVSKALQAYARFVTSADRGAVRDL